VENKNATKSFKNANVTATSHIFVIVIALENKQPYVVRSSHSSSIYD